MKRFPLKPLKIQTRYEFPLIQPVAEAFGRQYTYANKQLYPANIAGSLHGLYLWILQYMEVDHRP